MNIQMKLYRRVIAIARAGLSTAGKILALSVGLVFASVPVSPDLAVAQSTQTVSVGLGMTGTLPLGVTGMNVVVFCQTDAGNSSAAFFLQTGQTANLTNFALSSTALSGLGSQCYFTASVAGTSNTGLGLISISVGGLPVTVYGTNSDAANSVGGAASMAAPYAVTRPQLIAASTLVKVTLTYNPSLSWKTFGNIPTNVTGYEFSKNCVDSSGVALPLSTTSVAGGAGTKNLPSVAGADRCSYSFGLLGSGAYFTAFAALYIDDVYFPFLGAGKRDARGWRIDTTAQGAVATPGAVRLEIDFVGRFGVEVSADSVSPGGQPFEVSIACDKGGLKTVLSLNPGDRKEYALSTGTVCLVTETNSRGAVVAYTDNSGENTKDGRVLIGSWPTGCSYSPGGISLADPSCLIGVIIRNSSPIAVSAAPEQTVASTVVEEPTTTAATTTSTTTTSVAPALVFLPIPGVTVAPTSVAPASSVPATTLPTVVQTSIPVTTTNAPKPEATTTAVTVARNTTTTQPARTSVVTKSWTKRGLKPGSVVLVKTLQGKTVVRGLARANGSISLELPVGQYTVDTVMANGRKLTIRISLF